MNRSVLKTLAVGVALVMSTNVSYAETLKDPLSRNEDLSGTLVNVNVIALPSGFYEYLYSIETPNENKGTINGFYVDLSCDNPPHTDQFPEPADPLYDARFAAEGHYVPAQVYRVEGKAGSPQITEDFFAGWGMFTEPGTIVEGLRILSAAPPGKRIYRIEPFMSVIGWDYGAYEEDDPRVPWIPDFTVTGMTIGPACPGESELFPGSSQWSREPDEVNNLLSYVTPERDQFHLETGVSEVTMEIFYAPNIDPGSFKVEPGYLRRYFDPQPGHSQTVVLPVKNNIGQLRVMLSVRAVREDRGSDKVDLDKIKDSDVFVFTIDNPGNDKSPGRDD